MHELDEERFLDNLLNTHVQPISVRNDFAKYFTEWYQNLVSTATRKIEEWENIKGNNHTCSPGCYHCCFHLVEVYNIETLSILTYLKSNNLLNITEKAIPVANIIEEKLPNNPLQSGNEKAILNYKVQYILGKIPCIFLQDNKCLVYPVRPTNCVTYYSYGPREDCYEHSPKYGVHMKFIEDWMTKEIMYFISYNKNKLPKNYFNFNTKILALAIRDLLLEKSVDRV
jgi:Fe-S-cluster containining protein